MAEFALDPTPRATVRKVLYRGNPGTSDTLLYTSPNLPGGRTEVSRIVVAGIGMIGVRPLRVITVVCVTTSWSI